MYSLHLNLSIIINLQYNQQRSLVLLFQGIMLKNIKEFNLNEEARFKYAIQLMKNETRVSQIFLQKITHVDISKLLFDKSKWAQYFVSNISELKMSEKQFMNEVKAINTFNYISILYLLISDEIKLKKDQIFLNSAYKSLFKLRKIDMLKKRNQKNIIILEGIFELSQFKQYLKDNQLEEGCLFLKQKIIKYQLLKENNKQLVIILNKLYSIDLNLHDLLDRKSYEKIIRLIRLKDSIISQYSYFLDDQTNISEQRITILNLSIRFLKEILYNSNNSMVIIDKNDQDINYAKNIIQKYFQPQSIKNNSLKIEFQKIMEKYTKLKKDTLVNEIIQDINGINEVQPSKRKLIAINQSHFSYQRPNNKRKLMKSTIKENQIKFIAFSPIHHLKKPFSYQRIKDQANKKRVSIIDNRSLLQQLQELKQKKLFEMDKNIVMPDITQNSINILHTKSVKKIKQVKKQFKEQKRLSFIKESFDEDIKLLQRVKIKCLVQNSGYVEMKFHPILKKNIYEVYVIIKKPNKHQFKILFDKIEKIHEQQFLSTLAFRFKTEMEKSPLFYEFFSNIKNSQTQQIIEHTKKILENREIPLNSKKIINFQYIRSHLQKYIYWSYRETRKSNGSIYQRIKINQNITDTLKFASYLKNFKENIVDGEIIVKNMDILKNKNKKILIQIFKFLHTGKQIIFHEIVKKDLLNFQLRTLIIHQDTFKDIGAILQSLCFKNIKLYNQYFQFKGLVSVKQKQLIKFPEEQFLSSFMIENLMEDNIKKYKRRKLIDILNVSQKFEYISRVSSINLLQDDYKIEIKEFIINSDSKQGNIKSKCEKHQFHSIKSRSQKKLKEFLTPRPEKCFEITKKINERTYIIKIIINYLQQTIKFQCVRYHTKFHLKVTFDNLNNNNKLRQFQEDVYRIYNSLVILETNLYNILGLQLNTIYLSTSKKLDSYLICKEKNQQHIKHARLIIKKIIRQKNVLINNRNNKKNDKFFILLVERNYSFNFWQISIYDAANSKQSTIIINLHQFFHMKINSAQFQKFQKQMDLKNFCLKELYELTLKIDTAEPVANNNNKLDIKIKNKYIQRYREIQRRYWDELTQNLSINQNIIKIRKQIFQTSYFIMNHCIYQPKLKQYKNISMYQNISNQIIIVVMDYLDLKKIQITFIPISKAQYIYKSELVTFNRQRTLKVKLKDICYFFIEKIKEDLLSNYKTYIVSINNLTFSKTQLEILHNEVSECQKYIVEKEGIILKICKLKLPTHILLKINNQQLAIQFNKNKNLKQPLKQIDIYQRFMKYNKYLIETGTLIQ